MAPVPAPCACRADRGVDMAKMKFGVMFANLGDYATGRGATELAKAAEGAGFESIWAVEHVLVPKGYESTYPYDESGKMPLGGGAEDVAIPDPLIWLSWVAAVTSTIRLATGVMILPQRNPGVLAKEVATLDAMSGGRMSLGIGVGWLEEEFRALGVPFRERGARTDDAMRAMRALWESPETAQHHGKFFDFENVYSRPRPANGTVPLIVGGHTEAAARRAGRLGDGFFPGRGKPRELAELFALVKETAAAHGRDPEAIEFTTGGKTDPGYVERLIEIGVHRMIVPAASIAQIEAWGRELVEPFA